MLEKCLICQFPAIKEHSQTNRDEFTFDCFRCGTYRVDGLFAAQIGEIEDQQIVANISGWLREHQNELLDIKRLNYLKKLKTPSVAEKGNKILTFLSEKYPMAGMKIDMSVAPLSEFYSNKSKEPRDMTEQLLEKIKNKAPLLSISWTQHHYELQYILEKYLEDSQHFILFEDNNVMITPAGWSHIEQLKKSNPNSELTFVAIEFSDDLLEYCDEYIFEGISLAGYKPERADKKEHNDLIDDKIASLIRQSRFIVADFTNNNRGVYYEAGFARGLGIPVICLCRKNDFESDETRVHFDIQHYDFILWEEENGERLVSRLQSRIEATIGKGNLSRSS